MDMYLRSGMSIMMSVTSSEHASSQKRINGILPVALQGKEKRRSAIPVCGLQVSATTSQVFNDQVRLRAGVACRHMQWCPFLHDGVR